LDSFANGLVLLQLMVRKKPLLRAQGNLPVEGRLACGN
jgi:hypothetical protein